MYSRLNGSLDTQFFMYQKKKRINKNRTEKKIILWTTEPGSMWTNPPHIHSTTESMCKPLQLPPSPLLLPSSPLSATPTHIYDSFSPSLSFSLSDSLSPPLLSLPAPSDEGQDAVDEDGHDGGAEQAGHGHRDEPRQEDVPEEAPVHCSLGADPTHGHDRAHLEAAARSGERKTISSSTEQNVQTQSRRRAAGLSVLSLVVDGVRLCFSGLAHILSCF